MRVGNMTAGAPSFLPGFGISNITPQHQELNKILAERNLTLAEAKQLQDGGYQAILKQADAQAKVNIELELANKTSDIMKNGFDSLFQALLDGTQSFRERYEERDETALADLAAAYMTAAYDCVKSNGTPRATSKIRRNPISKW